MSDFVYLYGFVPADASPPLNLHGIGERPVELIPVGSVRAAVSRVPAEEYNPDVVETKLQELAWVAAQGVAHETVVAWFVDHAQILPAPLFTMFSSDEALVQQNSTRIAELASEIERLRNKREWDVKVSFNERELEKHAAALSPKLAAVEQEASQATPGKRYLLQKQHAELLKSETRNAAHGLAREVLDLLIPAADEHCVLPIPSTSAELPVILYAALLVDRDREVDVIQLLERQSTRLESLGMGLTFSGPWAPYRFTGEHDRAPAQD